MIKIKSKWAILSVVMLLFLTGCSEQAEAECWNVEEYVQLSDIISIDEIVRDDAEAVRSYTIRYRSDDCEVISYLSIPEECLENKTPFPCVIFNRGGNGSFGMIEPQRVAGMAATLGKIVFASQYRGVAGGTGMDEFGGSDVHDVIKLIDLCEEFSFVDMDRLYMMGVSRGGMMTYLAVREDSRIKKAVVVSGLADAFMGYEEREDMHDVYFMRVGGTPEYIPEEYEKRSATYWAAELKCPVLIIHSKLDARVSYAQAEKMVQCLEDAGKEYKFVSYEDDVHGFHEEDVEIMQEWLQ